TAPEPGRVNFAHGMAWRALGERAGEFRLSVRADYPRLFDVDMEVLQNPVQPLAPGRAIYLPYWPVPGLVPRDPERREVKTVAYAGRIGGKNLSRELLDGGLKAAGSLEFRVIGPDRWHDMREVDILLAVRSLDRETHDDKPASKLWNAWRAGIPLVAGWDSAFSAVGRPGEDYLRCGSIDEVTAALERLSGDAAHYERISAAGLQRAPEVSHEAIAREWLDALDGPVAAAFEAWRARGGRSPGQNVGRTIDRLRNLGTRLRQGSAAAARAD
ncbi:MAG: hypothetical protein AB7E69_21435, partial [Sphingomonadales bacterium]